MEFLHFLEGLRVDALDHFFAALTWLGHPYLFLLIGVTLMWCVSKRKAYYLFCVGIIGTVANQWLKLTFRIPRPWVQDPSLTIVETARGEATGYSFPSGHTQFATGITGCLIATMKKTWIRVLCAILFVLVPFSRMYLGVHTPMDVGVATAMSVALILVLYPLFKDEKSFEASVLWVLIAMCVASLAFAIWGNLTTFPADVDPKNLNDGLKNSYLLLGCSLGLLVSRIVDVKWLHYEVKAPFKVQAIKLVLGLAILIGIILGIKPLLVAAFGDVLWINVLRYFVAVIFAGAIWPLTFPWFARFGEKAID